MKNDNIGADASTTLRVNEIFYSIQGESTHAGRACIFIRLTYCNLRCSYCDTTYAFFEGQDKSLAEIINQIKGYDCQLVEITGGEPLIQKNVHILMQMLCDQGYEVLIETAGHMDISGIDSRIKKIMDIKCPGSGETEKMMWSNMEYLREDDEVKFVVSNENDLEWMESVIKKYKINETCEVIVSPVFGKMDNRTLAEWILNKHLPVRMQIQLHKQIWEPDARGR
jgi:7-carboxy-7-deazaguanine synthase